MADFTLTPQPLKQDQGTGFWKDLLEMVKTAKEIFESNTVEADSSDSSASPADIPFDSSVATVDEFITGINTVLDTLSATDD